MSQNVSNVMGFAFFHLSKIGFVSTLFFVAAYADLLVLLRDTIYWPWERLLRVNIVG